MALEQELGESFDQVVPGGASRGMQFLGIIQQRANESQFGFTLAPIKPNRRQERVVLRGELVFGNAWKGKVPHTIEVFADPMGPTLHVGWQLTSVSGVGGIWSGSETEARIQNKQNRVRSDPNTIRQLNGILQAFHAVVFLPTLQQLSDSVARSQAPQGNSGFFGA